MPALRATIAALFGLAWLIAAARASATVVVPVPETVLIDQAVMILTGEVRRIESHWDPARRQVFTLITLGVHDVLKGGVAVGEVTLKQAGGRAGGIVSWVGGSPEFRRGERVLVFLRTNADGTLRVAHLFQGKLSLTTDPVTADTIAHRAPPPGVVVMTPPRGAVTGSASVAELLDVVKRRIEQRVAARGRAASAPAVTQATAPSTTVAESQDEFTFLGSPSRWFEPDSGVSISMHMNGSGEPYISGSGFPQVRSGYAAWNAVTGSAARFRDAGFTSAAGFAYDGVNSVSFRDPLGQIDPPSGCSGTLATGGYFRSDETRTVNGMTFYRILEGDIVFADGWQGCGFYEYDANVAEVAAHELGHVLGFGHTSDPESIMGTFAHFDGRGARLGADDVAGVRFVYPETRISLAVVKQGAGTGSVASSPAGITCGSDCSESYAPGTAVTLTATPASGSTFGGWGGGGCSGTGTCRVTLNSATTVTATFNTASSASPPTASFSYPAPGAVVKGVQSVGMATSKWGSAKSLTLSVDGRVLVSTTMTGTTYWYSWDTRTVADGARTLTLVIGDSAGSTTASLGVTVANGGTAPPPPPPAGLTASFTAPASGATISGTATIGMASAGGASGSRTFKLEAGAKVLSTQTVTGTSASYAWNTTAVPNGSYTLKVTVTDSAGVVATATRSVTVSNSAPPPSSFTASFTHPGEGVTTWGTQSIGMSTTAPWGVSKTFTLSVDGRVILNYTTTGTTLWYSWDTRTAANGARTLRLTVTSGGVSATATRTLNVKN